jgi:hypothetical protein
MKVWLLLGAFIIFVFAVSTAVQASGALTTSQASQAGQVMVRNENGVLYLTNEVVEGGQAESSTSTGSGTRLSRFLGGGSGRFINLYPPNYARNPGQIIRAVLNLVLIIAVLLVFFYIVLGALEWITSGGDKAKTEKARQKIVSAVVGLIIVVSSYAILTVVTRFLGFNLEGGLEIPSIDDFPASDTVSPATPSGTPVVTPTPTIIIQ